MKIITRNGSQETIRLDEITDRLRKACEYCGDLSPLVDPVLVSVKVVNSIRDNITTSELDETAARICMCLSLQHPDWGKLGSRIIVSNHQKNTKWSFYDCVLSLWQNCDINGKRCPLVSEELFEAVDSDPETWENLIEPERDFLIDYFGFKTLEKSYLIRTQDTIIRETPQYLFLRVAIGMWGTCVPKVKETYDMLSLKLATHATPTLFNSGTRNPQNSSCFLLGTTDSVEGIYKTITDCARISKWAGGIGVHISNIRCKGSYIKGTGGHTSGIVPMMKVYNNTARYIDQAGKRNGSFALYLEPWHGDIIDFLHAMRNHGNEEVLARDLFYALWIPDEFMRCVKENDDWYLMCPEECPNLTDTVGEDFEYTYYSYVEEKKYRKKVKAREIWNEILKSQIESGMPYMLYKDHINRKTNQSNLGVIKSSNLCAEIAEYSDSNSYAVCNLASLCLPKFTKVFESTENFCILVYTKNKCKWCDLVKVFLKQSGVTDKYMILYEHAENEEDIEKYKKENGIHTYPRVFIENDSGKREIGGFEDTVRYFRKTVDYFKLEDIIKTLVRNLNRVIDINYYPVEETEISNLNHRPTGIGVQGLADLFAELWMPYDSEDAIQLNKELFEAIYYFAMKESCELAKQSEPYDSFWGSPLSNGKFQFDLWNVKPCGKWNWEELRGDVVKYGVRNSLLIALMPTASTSQIMGNTESFEPFGSCMYVRRTLSGEFIVVNKILMGILHDLGLWDQEMKERIMYHRGSIQKIKQIPEYIRDMYKTVWEIKKKTIIDTSCDRGAFVCQSQSQNIYMEECTPQMLTKMHIYGWSKGIKTGSYYIRSRPATNAQNFTIDPDTERKFKEEMESQEKNECLMCSS